MSAILCANKSANFSFKKLAQKIAPKLSCVTQSAVSELTVLYSRLVLSGVGFDDLVVEPHVGDSHPVLRKSSSLVGADGGSGAEGLDGFQVLDQAVLGGHALGSQGQAHGHSSEQTFGHVGDNDTCNRRPA